jgi:hypothetical protein
LAALVELMLQCIQERREARGTADGLLLVLRIEVVHVVEVDDVEVALCRLLDKSSSDLVGQPHRHGQTIADWGRETCDQSRESGLIPAFKLVDFLVALEKLECRHAGHFVGLDEVLIHVNESLESQSTPLASLEIIAVEYRICFITSSTFDKKICLELRSSWICRKNRNCTKD